ncbi:hypothetical protein CLU90_0999 [Janthinobacterium sp. 67]|uniref:hypothetical protein n=1 Tax=Janthinobacterium sp. 67 TaxID=2035207 RepID=UPI000C23CA2B|nr:hypothetical protein [Janthinobacterium sp. 67]PJJ17819.1 hypothetical protein CLU90_0999 [Janthinobacterium sp. 67]
MQYDFNLPGNGGQVIDVKGRFVKYRSGTGYIRVRLSNGGYADLLPGQGIFNIAFDSLTIIDRTGLANAGTILAGDFDFRDDRIYGDVNVIDNSKGKVIAGSTFYRLRAVGGIAANYSFVQLFNPLTSGVNISLNRIMLSSDVTNLIGMTQTGAEAGASLAPANKCIGMADGLLKCNGGNVPGPAGGTAIGSFLISANLYTEVAIRDPIVLLPGRGVSFQTGSLNAGIYVSVDCEQFI